MVRNEMEVVLRCENYVQVDALTVVDFTKLYEVMRRLLLSSRVSSLVIVNKLITNSEMTAKLNIKHCEINNLKRRLEHSFLIVKKLPFSLRTTADSRIEQNS